MKEIIKNIARCDECPNLRKSWFDWGMSTCDLEGRVVDKRWRVTPPDAFVNPVAIHKIPHWCPLPDSFEVRANKEKEMPVCQDAIRVSHLEKIISELRERIAGWDSAWKAYRRTVENKNPGQSKRDRDWQGRIAYKELCDMELTEPAGDREGPRNG